MSRLVRPALLLALVIVLGGPYAAVAEPRAGQDDGIVASPQSWLASLWEPIARLFGATEGGPTSDPNGTVDGPTGNQPSATGSNQTEGGPTIDPNGIVGEPTGSQPPATGSNETDGGPTIDPDG